MLLCFAEPPGRFLLLLFIHFCSSFFCYSSFIFVLYFVVVLHSFLVFILLLFFIHFCSSFVVVVLHSLLFNVIPHPSVDYCRVFTPILYFQHSPSQSDLQHFHFNLSRIFFHSFTASATVLSGRFLPTGIFYLTLLHRHF